MIEFCKMLFQANLATNRRCRNAVLITLLFWCAIASITLWMYANDGEIFWAGLPLAIFVPMALEDAFCRVIDMGDCVLLFIALCAASPSVPWFLFFLMGSAALYMGIHTLCVASAEEALHQDRQNTAPMWKFAFPLLPFFGFGLFVYGLPVLVLSQNIPAGYAKVDIIEALPYTWPLVVLPSLFWLFTKGYAYQYKKDITAEKKRLGLPPASFIHTFGFGDVVVLSLWMAFIGADHMLIILLCASFTAYIYYRYMNRRVC